MEDTYKTITEPSEGIYTEKRSKFIAIALPVRTHEEIKAHLSEEILRCTSCMLCLYVGT